MTSNDSERYLWDGAVALAGFDPYQTAPDHPSVAGLRGLWATPPEHAQYATLYPPAALALFAFAASFGPDLAFWVWKAILALAGITSLILMLKVLRYYDREQHFALLALSPLLVFETGIGAHLDAILVLGLAIMLWAQTQSRWALMGTALGVVTCVKFSPLVLLVPLLFILDRPAFIRVAGSALLVIAGVYGSALLLGYVPLGILPEFLEKWRGGSPVFFALEQILDGPGLALATGALAAGGLLVSAFLAWRGKALLACTAALATPLLVSPVVFPWYLMILVPFLALRPSWTVLLWVTSVPVTYEVLDLWLGSGVWSPQPWPLAVIAIGWLIGLSLDSRIHMPPFALAMPSVQERTEIVN
ncbi:glycosyltransferase 87 family protein [Erythrobacter rubeus]|uniref:DUF2029 domain-containing protein n=1 Tax=Erythrobacter rubeus TaxID=2760803 RepID=A0ABR8KX44_9SPHN|nr:glycosyltransferase 87 family protein [Erythrobacter rubeus]MBD2842731.1 DUF2029 domain-containing protein [Erythrobacter rubeus]